MTDDTVAPAIDETGPSRSIGSFACGERHARSRRRRIGMPVGILIAGLLAIATLPSVTFAETGVSSVKQTCMEVGAVLSDGPDPGADPVGYAQAQILPLRELHTKDAKLKRAIDQLASAYQTFVRDDGKSRAAHRAVSVAAKKVDAICPGATS